MLSTRQIDFSSELKHIAELGQKGQLKEASALCQKVLAKAPEHPSVLFYAGILALKEKNLVLALECLQKAAALKPNDYQNHMKLGLTFIEMSELEKAIECFQKTISLRPDFGEAHYQLAMAYVRAENYKAAEAHARMVITLSHPHPAFHNTLGNILLLQNNPDEAINQFQMAISLNPDYAECYYNLASAYRNKGRLKKALSFYNKTISLKPDHLGANHYAGVLATRFNQLDEALQYFKNAQKIEPNEFVYYCEITFLLAKQKKYLENIAVYEKALTIFPQQPQFLEGIWMSYRYLCDWDAMEKWERKLMELCDICLRDNLPYTCYSYYWWTTTVAKKFDIAKNISHFVFAKERANPLPNRSLLNTTKKKLRIGYVTADLRDHPAAHLTKNFYKHHDRERFEIFLYSIGPEEGEHYHHIISQVDHFISLRDKDLEETAHHIYNDQCDIVVDMNGFTEFSRPNIFVRRVAAIQISWLGYIGSLGIDAMDYIIMDPTSFPQDILPYYTEKPIYLPYTCFPADNELDISSRIFTRAEVNLPQDAMVLCCFNRPVKYDPHVFKVWMNLLHKIPHAVLWLYVPLKEARDNLCKTAQQHGINPDRLFFAGALPKSEYLARLKLADLFVDTFHYTAHTTAFDALWAGLPLITCLGKDPASRITGGILKGANLEELVTHSEEEYFNKIIHYATHPDELHQIREKLNKSLSSCPAFNTPYFVKWLERGYEKAWELYAQGKKPEPILVEEEVAYDSTSKNKTPLH